MLTNSKQKRSLLFLPLALLAVFALVVSACSGDDNSDEEVRVTDDDATESTQDDDGDVDVDDSTGDMSDEEARAAVTEAMSAIAGVESGQTGPMRIVGEIEMTFGESIGLATGPTTMSMLMEFDGNNYSSVTKMNLLDPESGEGLDMDIEQRYVDGVLYQNSAGMFGAMFGGGNADGPAWTKTDLTDLGETNPFDEAAGYLEPEDLDELGVFEDKGLVEHDGKTLRRIVAEGTTEDFMDDFDDMDDTFGNDSRMSALMQHAIENYSASIEFFLNEDNTLHSYRMATKLDVDTSTCAPLQAMTSFMPEMTGEFRFEALPADFTVQAPDPADVMDMGDMFGGIAGMEDLDDMDFDFDFGDDTDFGDLDFGFDDLDTDTSGVEAPSFDDSTWDFSDADFEGCPTS